MDNTIDGVVITLTDISDIKRASRELEETKLLAESIVETIREPFVVLDGGLIVRSANKSFYAQFKVNPADTVNRRIYELGDGQWDIPQLRKLLEEIVPADSGVTGYRVDHEFPGIGARVMMVSARRIPRTKLVIMAFEDVTGSSQAKEKE
jgi:two-component system CheB/CheR fusion protein